MREGKGPAGQGAGAPALRAPLAFTPLRPLITEDERAAQADAAALAALLKAAGELQMGCWPAIAIHPSIHAFNQSTPRSSAIQSVDFLKLCICTRLPVAGEAEAQDTGALPAAVFTPALKVLLLP
jgi:hypothetical protein